MTGGALLGLILISMGWLFFLAGLAANGHGAYKRRRLALGFLPGVVGSITVFFSIPAAAKYGWDVPSPWLWILLPLFLDAFLTLLARR